MTDGTFLSRAWPSIVALVGTVVVVFGLLFLFGDDDSAGDETTAGDDAVTDENGATDENADGGPATPDPDAEQTGDGTDNGDDTSGESDGDDGEEGDDSEGPPPTPVEAPPELRTPVGILNSTSIAGLAGGAQERFVDGGWEVPVITDYSGQVEGTTAYYPTDELQESAEALQAQFPEIRFVEPTPSGNLARDRILVILAEDYAEAVGATDESG